MDKSFMWKKFEINIQFKKISFGQKRPFVLRDFVPRYVFWQSRGGEVLKKNGGVSHPLFLSYLVVGPRDDVFGVSAQDPE